MRYLHTYDEFFSLHTGLSDHLAHIFVAISHFVRPFRYFIFIGVLRNWLPKKSGFQQFETGFSGKIRKGNY